MEQQITLEKIYTTLLDFKEETSNHFEVIDKRLDAHDKNFVSINERLDSNDKNFVSINKRLDSNDEIFVSINDRLTSLEHLFTKIEYEHGKKLDFLCDYVKVNNEKHEELEQRLDNNDAKIFNHDLRIEILEEKFPKAL